MGLSTPSIWARRSRSPPMLSRSCLGPSTRRCRSRIQSRPARRCWKRVAGYDLNRDGIREKRFASLRLTLIVPEVNPYYLRIAEILRATSYNTVGFDIRLQPSDPLRSHNSFSANGTTWRRAGGQALGVDAGTTTNCGRRPLTGREVASTLPATGIRSCRGRCWRRGWRQRGCQPRVSSAPLPGNMQPVFCTQASPSSVSGGHRAIAGCGLSAWGGIEALARGIFTGNVQTLVTKHLPLERGLERWCDRPHGSRRATARRAFWRRLLQRLVRVRSALQADLQPGPQGPVQRGWIGSRQKDFENGSLQRATRRAACMIYRPSPPDLVPAAGRYGPNWNKPCAIR
jgi:hypothetical protein